MKISIKILPVLAAASGLVFAQAALADDFGPRFSGDVPRAFQDTPADIDGEASALQDIAPAAGDEAPSEIVPAPALELKPEAESDLKTAPVEGDKDAAQGEQDEIAL
ncbi:MAG: hypothetical protein R3D66_02875 [Alphaproteobacteria bacterium]